MLPSVASNEAAFADNSAAAYHYTICGLPVISEVALPIPASAHGTPDGMAHGVTAATPGWVIRKVALWDRAPLRSPTIRLRDDAGSAGLTEDIAAAFAVHRDESGAWWWWESVGIFHVTPDARVVEVSVEAGADERSLGLALAGPVTVFVLHQLGYPTLHASAVALQRGVVAFLGGAGQGKSTMAAAFLRRGAALLADDMLPLHARPEGIYALPSVPIMKVWQPTARYTLGIDPGDLPTVSASRDKRLLWLDMHSGWSGDAGRLRAIYVLDRYEPDATDASLVTVAPLSGRAGLTALLAQTSCGAFLRPAEATRFLPLLARLVAQAPVRTLRFPSGFAHQEMVCDAVLRDVGTP